MGVHTALRVSDLLCIRWDDVYDFENKSIRKTITITEKKTGKTKIIALNKAIIGALTLLSTKKARQNGFIVESRKTGNALSRVQAYRIIRAASDALGLHPQVSCHSLRKTFGYHAWKNGVSPAVIMDIYNHSSLIVTKRYLGITQDDKNAVYLDLELLT